MIKNIFILLTLLISFLSNDLMAQKLYFSGPKESVNTISTLLINENWERLSRYYSLDNVDKEVIDSLKDGRYFIRNKRPEVVHPADLWKYRKPFPPNYSYLSHNEIAGDTIQVEVYIEIDQGLGMIQQGKSSFYLKKSEKGYQLLL